MHIPARSPVCAEVQLREHLSAGASWCCEDPGECTKIPVFRSSVRLFHPAPPLFFFSPSHENLTDGILYFLPGPRAALARLPPYCRV